MRRLLLSLSLCVCLFAGCAAAKTGDPQLGDVSKGPGIDKSEDATLRKLIAEAAPAFIQNTDADTGMTYNLFIPKNMEKGKTYPLVMFMADASTSGLPAAAPLSRAYGALVFASSESQAKNPCFVLVPQFSGAAVNDAYEKTPEVESALKSLENVVANNPIDKNRLYATGQSMGGMIAMYYNATRPDLFAASMYVDCHWDPSTMDALVKRPFVFVYAGNKSAGEKTNDLIQEACRKVGVGYAWMEWSAELPIERQDQLAATLLEKGNPVNLVGFESGTVSSESGAGNERMHSFDFAYRIAPLRDWLFAHSLNK